MRLADPGAEGHVLHDVGISAGTLKTLTHKAVRKYSHTGGRHHEAPDETVRDYASAEWTLTVAQHRRMATARVAETAFDLER